MTGDTPCSSFHPRRILVRGVNWLGDAVMTTPALLRLRERFPEAHITLLTAGKLADLWQRHPAVDSVVTFSAGEGPFSIAQRLRNPTAGARAKDSLERRRERLHLAARAYGVLNTLWETSAGVFSNRFDVALVLPNSPRSALEVWLARVPRRIGYARPWRNRWLTQAIPSRPGAVSMHKRSAGEIKRLVAVTSAPSTEIAPVPGGEVPPAAHHIHQYLHLAAALGADPAPLPPRLEVTEEEVQAVTRKFNLTEANGKPVVLLGLNPGAEYGPAKRWPADRFIEVAARVQRRVPCRWLILGGRTDAALAERITAEIRYEGERPPQFGKLSPDCAAVNLAGETSLRELMALLKVCRVLLTNDTGPMHVAAALGTPVVVPFGSTSPDLTGPGLPGDPRHALLKSDAPCSPCFRRECPVDFRCMNDISVERVVAAVLSVVAA
jgi:heptosyltransferase-2